MEDLEPLLKTLLAERDLDRMLSLALDGVIQRTGAERGLLVMFDPGGRLEVRRARTAEGEDLPSPRLEVSEGIVEQVRRSGAPFLDPNVPEHPALSQRESVLRIGLLSVACVPVRDRGRLQGALYLDHRQRRAFSRETLALAARLADLISLAVHRSLEEPPTPSPEVADEGSATGRPDRFDFILGDDEALREALRRVRRVAPTQARVLIQGETGTGKELFARAIHLASERRRGPFVAVNCGALPESLLESELFGHVRGAFTGAVDDRAGWFEEADGGTLFLDEVAEMTPAQQVRLLRVLETGEITRVGESRRRRVDVRVLSATHQDLGERLEDGRLRRDLLYRLRQFRIRLPPLRRRGDLELLVNAFLKRLAPEREVELDDDARRRLLRYPFPGNVRELQNVLQQALIVADGDRLRAQDLPEELQSSSASTGRDGAALPAPDFAPPEDFRSAKEAFEREYVIRCLEEAQGNIRKAAEIAELHYRSFYDKVRRLGIDAKSFRPSRD